MECNKDEAGRAREIAEKKFAAKDLVGAKKFAMKAHHLYPELDGLAQMMAVLDVHIAAENKVNGDMDWYGILHVNPFDDEATVRKQYRKLALLLHPDKNKAVGADGAFKFLSEAWSILSDKVKRMSYDQKRKGFQQRPLQPHKTASAPYPDGNASGVNNGFYNFNVFNNFTRCTAAPPANAQRATHTSIHVSTPMHNPASASASMPRPNPPAPRPPRQQKTTTFWTACPFCKMQYEYLRMYENHNLLCPNCQKAFCAVETSVNNMNESSASGFQWSFNPRTSQEQQKYSNHCTYGKGPPSIAGMGTAGFASGARVDSYQNLNNPWRPFTRPAGVDSMTGSSAAAAAAANVVQQTYEKVRREREEAQAAAKKKDHVHKKNSQFKKAATEKHTRHVPGSIFSAANQGTSEKMVAAKGVVKSRKKRKRKTDSDSYDESDDEDEEDFSMMEYNGTGTCGTSGHKSSHTGINVDNRVDAAEEKMNNGYNGSHKDQQRTGAWESCNAKAPSVSKFGKPMGRPPWNRDFSSLELRNMLMEKARMEIRKYLHEVKKIAENAAAAKSSASALVTGTEEDAKTVGTEMRETQNITGVQHSDDAKKDSKLNEVGNSGDSLENPNAMVADPVSMTVPDPDFYDFDRDRTEECFQENQMWAAYDDDDGMPRFYALIQKVASLKPFKLQISWLNARNNTDLGPIDWINAGFTKTCGDFRVGKVSSQDNINVFSHIIRWEKAPRGIIKIFPRKGDVWALYCDWSPSWDQHTAAEVRHKYDMVQVLTDFTEELGVSIIPLVKVAGYKTVFRNMQVDPGTVQWVPKKEFFKFSHQVPARMLTGEEAEDIPKGCMELDPAATPLELLQVIKDEQNR